jgi:hypothetical protein
LNYQVLRARKRILWVNLRFKTPINYYLPVFLTGFLQVIYRKTLLGMRLISKHSIRKTQNQGIHARIPAVKELLTAAQKTERFQFATAFADKTPEWWSKVIFSDEKTFGNFNEKMSYCF